jgi:phasin family protein
MDKLVLILQRTINERKGNPMSPLTEQFSEARNLQLERQFNFFHTFAGKAFESAEKLIALNFDASRASLEKSSALMRQMIAAKDPRDLFALTSQTQSQFESVLAYGRQLFGIAAGTAVNAEQPAAATPTLSLVPPAPAPAPATEAAPVASEAHALPESATPAPEVVVASEPAAAPNPIAEPNPIAKAAGASDELPTPSAASFPVPSSSKPIAVAPVKPVEAEPPHAPVAGTPEIVTKQAAAAPSKPARKK